MAQLQDLFQTHAVVKILDHLTLYKDFEYTKTDIANETGISRRTLYQNWPILERFDLVTVTKTSGMIKFYKLNTENPISRQLVTLADKISFFRADKIAELESVQVIQDSLPTQVSSYEDKTLVKRTGKVIIYEETLEGTPSQVEELSREMRARILDLTKGEITIPITDSTGFESAKKKRDQLRARIHGQTEIQ